MPVKLGTEARRALRPSGSRSGTGSSGAGSSSTSSSTSSGPGPNISGGVLMSYGGGPGHTRPSGLGPPDVYPQDPGQKEDELTAVHVKQGFTQSYSSMVTDEYGSVVSGRSASAALVAALANTKVLGDLKSIQIKKEESNTLSDGGKKRQSLNKENFWFVTTRNKMAVDNWFKDLAGDKPLQVLAKKVPIFNKREECLQILGEMQVPVSRAVWFIKMTAAYTLTVSENNKTKKRQGSDPSLEWTQVLIKYLKDQLSELNSLVQNGSSSVPTMGSGKIPKLS